MKAKKFFGVLVALLLVLINYSPFVQDIVSIPRDIRLFYGDVRELPYNQSLPLTWRSEDAQVLGFQGTTLADEGVYKAGETVKVQSTNPGSTRLVLELLGIPIRTIDVVVTPEYRIVPGGLPVGIVLYTEGALVVGVTEIVDDQGAFINPGRNAGLRPGDIIEKVDGQAIENAAHLASMIEKKNGGSLTVEYRRGGQLQKVTVSPVQDGSDGKWRLGLWVRDSSAGIGTLSYYDPNNGTYGALGHAITDSDTGAELVVREGNIVRADIIDIVRGERGCPGELKGVFTAGDQPLGTIEMNSSFGIFGESEGAIHNPMFREAVPIGSHTTVYEGRAQLLCTLDDRGIRAYECEIIRISSQSAAEVKSMIIKITDPLLLEKTGGIVQGMSGSPILQDGRIIGAVTHVFVNDPTRGYGVFIDWMLAQSNILE